MTSTVPGPGAPRRAENLLDQIAETALDDDYYLVRTGDEERPALDRIVWTVGLVLLAVLITVAAVQSRATRPSSDLEQRTLAQDVEQRSQILSSRRTTVQTLQAQVADLQRASTGDARLLDQQVLTGAVPVRGPGVVVRAQDSSRGNVDGRITARDVRFLVDGLWAAGAEAVAINGHRLGALSAIVPLQGGITVDYQRIGPPYRVVAIGGDDLGQDFRDGPFGRYWSERERQSGVRWGMTGSSRLEAPAAPQRRVSVDVARPLKEDR